LLLVQRAAPDFTAKAVESGSIVNLTRSDLLKSPLDPNKYGYALLIFYPLDFTFVCPTELTAYSDRIKEFHAEGCRIVGISVDSEYSHLQWSRQPRSLGGLCQEKGGGTSSR
jgi:alkyl hydroperoxide reductase subunit AhpC